MNTAPREGADEHVLKALFQHGGFSREVEHYASEMQDLFALGMLGVSKTFLDIGAAFPTQGNNTYLLEKNNWNGVCVDIRDFSEEHEKKRLSRFYQVDASTVEFLEILSKDFPDRQIDYISLDADEGSVDILVNLLDNGFVFKCMTFEHDIHYSFNYELEPLATRDPWPHEFSKESVEVRKYRSKDLLQNNGYRLLFEDVSFVFEDRYNQLNPWEDWWINPKVFPHRLIDSMSGKNLHHQKCVEIILNHGSVFPSTGLTSYK